MNSHNNLPVKSQVTLESDISGSTHSSPAAKPEKEPAAASTHINDDIIEIVINNDIPEKKANIQEKDDDVIHVHQKKKCLRFSKVALVPAFLGAGVEVADVMTSLMGANKPLSVVSIASATAFLTSFGLTGRPTELAFEEICDLIKTGRLPDDKEEWPKLSFNQELSAVTMTTILALWGSFSKFSVAYYILNTIPGDYNLPDDFTWEIASAVGAGSFALTGLLTDTIEAHKFIRKYIVGEKAKFTSRTGKLFGLGIGLPFGVINAAMDSTQATASISDNYQVKTNPGFWLIAGAATIIDGGQKLAFEGRVVIDSIYELVHHLQKVANGKERINPASAVAFSISVGLSAFLEYCKQSINYGFFYSEVGDFNLDNNQLSQYLLIISWLAFVGGILIGTPSLFPEMKTVVSGGADKIYSVKNRISSLWASPKGVNTEETKPLLQNDENAVQKPVEITPPTDSYGDYRQMLSFKRSNNPYKKSEDPEQKLSCGIL